MAKRKTIEQRMQDELVYVVRNQLQELLDYHTLRKFFGSELQEEELEFATGEYTRHVLLPIIHAWTLGEMGHSQVEIDQLNAVAV